MPRYLSHRDRKSIRLRHYNYCQPGSYFITICTHHRECLFGEILNGDMQLGEYGQIVSDCWQAIPEHFPQVQLDEFVVMPNHLHGILVLADLPEDMVLADMAMPCPYGGRRFGEPVAGSLSTIVGSFKSAATKYINQARGMKGMPVWQGRFYDHIIRDGGALENIRRYVRKNPQVWYQDQLHPDNPSQW